MDYEALNATPLAPLILPEAAAGHVATHRNVFFVMLPVFMGYATLFSLQHRVKGVYGISDDAADPRARLFNAAVACLYATNLLTRVGHLVVHVTVRVKAAAAIGAMFVAMVILVICIWWHPWAPAGRRSLWWVTAAYTCGGVGVGTFEANFLSAIAPLGPRTKMWATLGIPCGINIVTIGAFGTMAAGAPPVVIPLLVAGVLIGAGVTFWNWVPYYHVPKSETPRWDARMWASLARVGLRGGLPYAVTMFGLAGWAPGVLLYMFNRPRVALTGAGCSGASLPTPVYFAVFNAFAGVAAVTGRVLAYAGPPRHPAWGVAGALGALGLAAALVPSHAAVGWAAVVLLFLGNATVYNRTARWVDAEIPALHNAAAMSCWLFVGDWGSVAASNLTIYIKGWLVGPGSAVAACGAQ